MTSYSIVATPVGDLLLTASETALTRLLFPRADGTHDIKTDWLADDALSTGASPILAAVRRQLSEYFAGVRQQFNIPLHATGTVFQQRVWQALRDIPYGETIAYGTLAERIGNPKAVRAVGLANGRNPISIIVPCHRVIGANGSLTGYGGGLERKTLLLDLERHAG